MNISSGTLYICRPREFVRLNELTYKIGKTELSLNQMMSQYPGTEVIMTILTPDIHNTEIEVIKQFKLQFKTMNQYGKRYFSGNVTQMMRVMNEIVDNKKPI